MNFRSSGTFDNDENQEKLAWVAIILIGSSFKHKHRDDKGQNY